MKNFFNNLWKYRSNYINKNGAIEVLKYLSCLPRTLFKLNL